MPEQSVNCVNTVRGSAMKESQTRIQEIQERLQAIQAGHGSTSQSQPSSSYPRDRPNQRDDEGGFVLTMEPIEPQRPASAASSAMVELAPGRGNRLEERPPQLTNQVATLSQKSNQVVQRWQQTQFQQPHPQPTLPQSYQSPPQPARRPVARLEGVERLEGQIDRINQLSHEQEKALLELRAIADAVNYELKTLEQAGQPLPADVIPTMQYQNATVPCIERGEAGAFVLTSRAVNLYQAEHDAVRMADVLRHRTQTASPRKSNRSRGRQSPAIDGIRRMLRHGFVALENLFASDATGSKSPRSGQSYAIATPTPFTAQEGIVWLIGAIAGRLALSAVLNIFPGFWLPAMALIVVPAAIAVYRAAVVPQSSHIWGYRLFLAMVGLLIGGRLV